MGVIGNREGGVRYILLLYVEWLQIDTNDIWLFFVEANLKEQVEKSLNLPPTYETLVSRAQLASVCSLKIL